MLYANRVCRLINQQWLMALVPALFVFPGGILFAGDAAEIQKREPWTASRISGTPDAPPPYRVELAFPELKFEQPLDLAAAPGSDRLFVAQQDGKIYSFPNDSSVAAVDLVTDLKKSHPQLTALYAMTFHPQFRDNRKVYVCYVEGGDKPDGTFVSEFLISSGDSPVLDPASERIVIRWWSGGHNGCSLKFGPEGFLYISTGDGGAPSPPDPLLAGQDVSNLLSCILRIDVDHEDDEKPYRVPPDNPFVGMENVRPEIWAFGFRNPWRMSFDRATGDLWAGDVGWQLWEMIYRVERGGNYGWPIMEGPQPALPESRRGPAPILPPTVSHPHSEASSITGGFVYRGTRLSELQGVYVYGDFQSGKVWGLRHDGQRVTWREELATTPVQLVSFGEDQAGELYLVDYQRTQQIYRLVENPGRNRRTEFPQRLSETGLFADVMRQSPSSGVTAYSINAPHWADHTVSERWMAVPGTDPVAVDSDAGWQFPDGTVLTKTVSIEMVSGKPESARHLETQILHREEGSWRPYSFAWNDAQTDAELVPAAGFTRPLRIDDKSVPGGWREQSYRFAARSECQLCHNPWVEKKTTITGIQSASPLAVTVAQLNKSADGTSTENQLLQLESRGWISGQTLSELAAAHRFADPGDSAADLNERVRAYLHVNCAHCHQPHAGGTALIDLTSNIPLTEMKMLDARPAQGAFGISRARLVAPGDPYGSVLWYRIAKLGSGRMPRIGSDEVDERAVAMIRDWIRQLGDGTAERAELSLEPASASFASAVSAVQSGTDVDRSAAVEQLTSSTRGALALLTLVDDSLTLQPPLSPAVRQQIIAQASAHALPEVRDLFERFLPTSQRARRLGTVINTAELLALEAVAERGRQLFFRDDAASCKTCHRVDGIGETLGPDLSQIGKKYASADMLTQLLDPSRFIDEKYVPYVVETRSGVVHSGLLAERTDEEIVLRNAQNKSVRVAKDDIETLTTQQKSLMPELLLRDLTPQQAADLLAFLTSLK